MTFMCPRWSQCHGYTTPRKHSIQPAMAAHPSGGPPASGKWAPDGWRPASRVVGEMAGVGRRPFLVMTRNPAVAVLTSVLAAPVTRTIRGIPTERPRGPADGMPSECVASFDNLRVVPKANLVERI